MLNLNEKGWMLFSLFYQVSAVTFVGGSLSKWRQERFQLLGAVKAGDLAGRQKAVDLKTKIVTPFFIFVNYVLYCIPHKI